MASIIYLPVNNGLEERFGALLGIAASEKEMQICRSLGELSEMLREPRSNVTVAVLFAVNREDIKGILSLGDLMADVKSILILADEDQDTMVSVHKLRPRYVTWTDCDPMDIFTVLKRIVALYDLPH
jgi:hypothetical protein